MLYQKAGTTSACHIKAKAKKLMSCEKGFLVLMIGLWRRQEVLALVHDLVKLYLLKIQIPSIQKEGSPFQYTIPQLSNTLTRFY